MNRIHILICSGYRKSSKMKIKLSTFFMWVTKKNKKMVTTTADKWKKLTQTNREFNSTVTNRNKKQIAQRQRHTTYEFSCTGRKKVKFPFCIRCYYLLHIKYFCHIGMRCTTVLLSQMKYTLVPIFVFIFKK